MANLFTQERQELAMRLSWQQTASIIISDERTPTTNYASEITPSTALLELTGFTEKELDELLFMEDTNWWNNVEDVPEKTQEGGGGGVRIVWITWVV